MTIARDPLAVIEQFSLGEEIAAMLRHDLRGRLGAIRNSNYFLRKRVEKTDLWSAEPRVPKFFTLIDDEVAAADELMRAKLAIAELRTRVVEEMSLARVLDLAAGAVRGSGPIALSPIVDARVSGDLEELAVAIRALIENALEADPDCGASIETAVDEQTVTVLVSDRGPGIEDLSAALRPLFTTKPGRLGLGLNMAERIARRHGGSIAQRESSERGACVVLELPRAPG